jgi:hypothetical protein
LTTIENAASCALPPCPSLTPMPMFANVPTLADVGVPCNRPVELLNVAHAGRFVMLKVSVPPSGSLAVGWNEYAVPAVTDVCGTPLIVGGWLGAALTTIWNVASCALSWPSLTPMPMFANVPTCADAGVPCRRPVVVLNVAQLG